MTSSRDTYALRDVFVRPPTLTSSDPSLAAAPCGASDVSAVCMVLVVERPETDAVAGPVPRRSSGRRVFEVIDALPTLPDSDVRAETPALCATPEYSGSYLKEASE